MSDLRQRMYARIRTTRAMKIDLRLQEVLRCFADLSGNCARVDLLLPPAISGSVVLQDKLPGSRHRSISRFGGSVSGDAFACFSSSSNFLSSTD